MPTIKEYREFFIRHSRVLSGTKTDQELNFPLKYTNSNGNLVFNRFLEGDFPSEDVFMKLFESITFKLNAEDTATEDLQGLSKAAKDTDVTTRKLPSAYTDSMTRFVLPHQIPYLEAADSSITVVETTKTVSGKTVKLYTVKVANSTTLNPELLYKHVSDVNGIVNTSYNNHSNKTITLASGSLSTDEVIKIEGFASIGTTSNYMVRRGNIRLNVYDGSLNQYTRPTPLSGWYGTSSNTTTNGYAYYEYEIVVTSSTTIDVYSRVKSYDIYSNPREFNVIIKQSFTVADLSSNDLVLNFQSNTVSGTTEAIVAKLFKVTKYKNI